MSEEKELIFCAHSDSFACCRNIFGCVADGVPVVRWSLCAGAVGGGGGGGGLTFETSKVER